MHEFRVWAPSVGAMGVKIDKDRHAMEGPDAGGWWSVKLDVSPEADYAFLIDDDPTPYPDPRGARMPNSVHGASRLYDQSAYHVARRAMAGAAALRRHHL